MFTYIQVKDTLQNSYDNEDFLWNIFGIPIYFIGDIIFLIFQPIFIITYILWIKKYKSNIKYKNN